MDSADPVYGKESDMAAVTYHCTLCNKEATIEQGEPVPVCCGREMEPLPFCTTAPHAEMARNYEADEPCDPGTVPRKKSE